MATNSEFQKKLRAAAKCYLEVAWARRRPDAPVWSPLLVRRHLAWGTPDSRRYTGVLAARREGRRGWVKIIGAQGRACRNRWHAPIYMGWPRRNNRRESLFARRLAPEWETKPDAAAEPRPGISDGIRSRRSIGKKRGWRYGSQAEPGAANMRPGHSLRMPAALPRERSNEVLEKLALFVTLTFVA